MHPASIFIVDDHPLVRHGLRQLIDGEPDLSVCGDADSVSATMNSILIFATRFSHNRFVVARW